MTQLEIKVKMSTFFSTQQQVCQGESKEYSNCITIATGAFVLLFSVLEAKKWREKNRSWTAVGFNKNRNCVYVYVCVCKREGEREE